MNPFFTTLLVVLSLLSTRAFGDGFVKLAGTYLSSKSGDSESKRTLIDLNAAYVTQGGWAFGAIYAQEKLDSGGGSASRTSMGPSVGWITRKENGAYVIAHYLFQSEFEQYKGDGYQGDLGYKFKLRKVALAMQMSYKAFNYKELNGAKLSTPYKETKIDPYFALLIEF